ncbi:MAG: hypothetical protein M3Y04_02375 [Actinomycetota bacterium]|nr:hypothetical protein [Actinomycetota bacterium]
MAATALLLSAGRTGGTPATLSDVTPGATIEAVGRPSNAQTIVARKLTLA